MSEGKIVHFGLVGTIGYRFGLGLLIITVFFKFYYREGLALSTFDSIKILGHKDSLYHSNHALSSIKILSSKIPPRQALTLQKKKLQSNKNEYKSFDKIITSTVLSSSSS